MSLQIIEGAVIQVLFTVFSAPLYVGIFGKAKAMIEGKQGPSILQPYYDIFKLLKKRNLNTS